MDYAYSIYGFHFFFLEVFVILLTACGTGVLEPNQMDAYCILICEDITRVRAAQVTHQQILATSVLYIYDRMFTPFRCDPGGS